MNKKVFLQFIVIYLLFDCHSTIYLQIYSYIYHSSDLLTLAEMIFHLALGKSSNLMGYQDHRDRMSVTVFVFVHLTMIKTDFDNYFFYNYFLCPALDSVEISKDFKGYYLLTN